MQREIWIEPEFGLLTQITFNEFGLISSISCPSWPWDARFPRVNDRIDLINSNFKFQFVMLDGQKMVGL